MQTKATSARDYVSENDFLPLIEAYFELNNLKQLYRQGWLQQGIDPERCESVAEHSFAVAILALFLSQNLTRKIDLKKVLIMALIHDFGEIYAGDFTPSDSISSDEKYGLEYSSVVKVFSKLPLGSQLLSYWQEYESRQSLEAQLVHQLDCLELVLQACIYEYQEAIDLSHFFQGVEGKISLGSLQTIFQKIKEIRP
ncbi:MAG: HD domain-containing protein [Cyanobacteria bacterium J06592_8]